MALLTCLILDGRDRPMSRDALIDLLWSDATDDRGRHSLAQAITVLRKTLGADSLSRGRAEVRLLADVTTELDDLDRLVASGDAEPLDGMDGWAGTPLAHWTDGARVRIGERAVGRLREAIQQARREGDIERVYRLAVRLHSLDPLAAVAVLALAERRLVEGDSVGALRLLRSHASQVRSELACDPDPDITRLLRRLEQGAGAYLTTVPGRLATAIERVRPTMFLGRERELARLEAEWTRVSEGQDRALLIKGVGGIGKSAILRRFATGVGARSHPVHVVTCQEIAAAIPYAAVSDLIASIARDPSVSGTDPMWLGEATRIYPALRARYPGIPEPPNVPPEVVCVRIAESVRYMLEAVAEDGPVLVGFDDLQHLDATSRAVLSIVQRRLADRPVMLLGARRSDRIDGIDSIEHPGAALNWQDTLSLEPLDEETTRTLATRLSEDLAKRTDVCDAIVGLAQGNPYFAEMLVADWTRHRAGSLAESRARGDGAAQPWQPPPDLRTAFARLYEGLQAPARHMLQLLAVARRGLVPEALAGSLGLETARLDEAVLAAIERGLIRLDGRLLCFKHELNRAYVYWGMPADARRFHHGRLAQTLRALAGDTAFGELLEAGRHFLDAGRVDEAREATVEGSRRAVSQGAPSEAEQALLDLIKAVPSIVGIDVIARLADAQLAQGKARAALHTLDVLSKQVIGSASSPEMVVLRAEALHRQRETDDHSIIEACHYALRIAKASGDARLIVRAAQATAEAASEIGLVEEVDRARTTARDVVNTTSVEELQAHAFLTEGYCEMMSGELGPAAKSFARSAQILANRSNVAELARAQNGRGMCALALGDVDGAIQGFGESIRAARYVGDIDRLAAAWGNLGVAYELAGDFDVARRCSEEAIRFATEVQNPRRLAEAQLNAADVSLIAGNLDEMEEFIRRAEHAAMESRLWRFGVKVELALADLWLARGHPEAAWPVVERATRAARGWTRPPDFTGRYRRLVKHLALAVRGESTSSSVTSASSLTNDGSQLQIADKLELSIFDDWAGYVYCGRPLLGTGLQEAVERGFYGLLARLIAVGVQPSPTMVRRDGETTVELLDRIFPAGQRQPKVLPLSALSLDAESPYSDRKRRQLGYRTENPDTFRALR